MSSRTFRRTVAAICLAAALAVPVHALPTRAFEEPIEFSDRLLTWAVELWSAVWAQESAPLPPGPADGGERPAGSDEGHMIDPDG